jgi:hypothetical protein
MSLKRHTWVDDLKTEDNDNPENNCDVKDARVCKICGNATTSFAKGVEVSEID